MSTIKNFAERLLHWYDSNGRHDLPWQQNITPYRVWLSEIMLQQTQVKTVLPYYLRFTEAFPSVQALANASLNEVLHLWTGLGYYARARNLHRTAQILVNDFDGEFPDTPEALVKLPGIGRSTAGAICAIAFQRRASILDGNVKRVLARLNTISGYPGHSAISKQLWAIAEQYTPDNRVADYTQAIMDLGATLCTRTKPECIKCPFQTDCQGFISGDPSRYPGKKNISAKPVKDIFLLILENRQGQVLLQQRPDSGIWGGLWSFPECPLPEETAETQSRAIHSHCRTLGYRVSQWAALPQRQHHFSHYQLNYTPVTVEVEYLAKINDNNSLWIWPKQPGKLGLPRPIKTLLDELSSIKSA